MNRLHSSVIGTIIPLLCFSNVASAWQGYAPHCPSEAPLTGYPPGFAADKFQTVQRETSGADKLCWASLVSNAGCSCNPDASLDCGGYSADPTFRQDLNDAFKDFCTRTCICVPEEWTSSSEEEEEGPVRKKHRVAGKGYRPSSGNQANTAGQTFEPTVECLASEAECAAAKSSNVGPPGPFASTHPDVCGQKCRYPDLSCSGACPNCKVSSADWIVAALGQQISGYCGP